MKNSRQPNASNVQLRGFVACCNSQNLGAHYFREQQQFAGLSQHVDNLSYQYQNSKMTEIIIKNKEDQF